MQTLKPQFEFDRYVNGTLMAEGVTIEREITLEAAMKSAARLASKGPNGEIPVLVYRPAAPVEGLEVVAYRYRHVDYVNWAYSESRHPRPDIHNEELVTLTQAESIIAAERERADAVHKADAKAFLSINSRYEKAEADNAALTARVKELEQHVSQLQEKNAAETCACSYDAPMEVCKGHSPVVKALETQLTAVRKALARAAYGFDQIHKSLMSNGPKQASGEVTAFFLDETRAALEGKP